MTKPFQAPAAAAKAALAWAHGARFLTTASRLDQLPVGDVPEIAFVGRSNAGKSTCINTLAQQKQLAFASRTPGRTQHINLFALGPRDGQGPGVAYWADLPGYGYAAVERAAKLRWQEVMAQYLELRRNLHGVVLMVDSRLGFTPLDEQLLTLLGPRVRTGEVRLLALLTKADKLNRSDTARAVATAQEVLAGISSENADIGVTAFSSLSRLGVEDVAEALHAWALAAPSAAPGGMPALADDPVSDGAAGQPGAAAAAPAPAVPGRAADGPRPPAVS